MESTLEAQITFSAVVVWLMERLKTSKYFPFLTAETARLNQAVAVAASGLVALGVHLSFDAPTGVLTISGLTLSGIGHNLLEWLRSFVVQQMMFRGYKGATR